MSKSETHIVTEVSFELSAPSFSINRMYYANKMSKTKEARDWTLVIQRELMKKNVQSAMEEVRSTFDPMLHFLRVELDFFYPHATMWNKEGTISAKKHDVSNIEKPLIDIIYDEAYKCLINNLGINDKYNLELESRQGVHEESIIHVRLFVKKRESMIQYSYYKQDLYNFEIGPTVSYGDPTPSSSDSLVVTKVNKKTKTIDVELMKKSPRKRTNKPKNRTKPSK
jgi:hypothetical protein